MRQCFAGAVEGKQPFRPAQPSQVIQLEDAVLSSFEGQYNLSASSLILHPSAKYASCQLCFSISSTSVTAGNQSITAADSRTCSSQRRRLIRDLGDCLFNFMQIPLSAEPHHQLPSI
ncbi:hypothetical protein VTL71DRAFT_10088 [Oculimacula yallundae]|uniref:Uncharacterized protein n=1 Tax=Oculimacula yallundae TaxID=86028 RepID=A0ABR4BTE3_9HELO